MATVYLDNNATTRVAPSAVEAMLPFLTESYGNASSRHGPGSTAALAVRMARKQVQRLIGAAHDDEIIFTSGGTEANTTAIHSAIQAYPERKVIVTSAVEHPAVLAVCHDLANRGYDIREIGVDAEGRIHKDAYQAALGPDVALATVMWANNETGAVFPIPELAKMAHEKGVLFHTDAVQATGKVSIHIQALHIDMLSMSGHKLHAPKGIGALYLRKGSRFHPLLRGGHQEKGRRAGTENVPAIVAFGTAANLARQDLTTKSNTVATLRDTLQDGLQALFPDARALAAKNDRLPNTLAMVFPGVAGEALLAFLDRLGVIASGGSACSAGAMSASHVPLAMGLPSDIARTLIRFSLSHQTTATEIANTIEAVQKSIRQILNNSGRPQRSFPSAYV